MSKITATSSGKDFPLIPVGMYIARCIQMIHIGTIPAVWKGETKDRNVIRLVFETPDEQMIFDEAKGMQPFTVSKKFTLSMSDKANLLKEVNAWRGKPLTKKEAEAFDVSVLAGKPCMINVIHDSFEGNAYAKITSISPLPKNTVCPPQINPTVVFGFEPFSIADFNALPDWLQEEVKKSKEYRKAMDPTHTEAQGENPNKVDSKSPAEQDDDLPF